MRRPLLRNLVLLALVAGLAWLAWTLPGRNAATPEKPRLLGDTPIRLIELTRPGGGSIRLERDMTGWHMATPYAVAPEPLKIAQLVDALHAEVLADYPAEAVDLREAGLVQPGLRVRVNGERELAFGATTPVDYHRYVRRGDRVLLIDSMDYYAFDSSAEELVDRDLLPDDAGITGIELPDGPQLIRDPEGWRAAAPHGGMSADRIVALVQAWQQARAAGVQPVAPARSERARCCVRITLAGENGPRRYRIADTGDGGLLLIRPELGLAWQLDAAWRERLLQLPPATRPPDTPGVRPDGRIE